ncbi:thioredoxin domain-containing protein [Tautonia sociabilis]|uniref:Thioredoxin domain-containing protein n=2 Tax=Tautonia sociabilis TaxID=2080755 RepID=A0A432ML66_9BACT|nr:thioredoxin domain-containing protein [Tautonia sociabilis]
MQVVLAVSLIFRADCAWADIEGRKAAAVSGTEAAIALPGAEAFPEELIERFSRRRETLGTNYVPRTRHVRSDGRARYTNRLFLEASPYLLQHAHNPVNWYPWGDEAFEVARKLERPVLLSVGYSTCHWCHVMEEESFEDEEIASFLNSHYVAIKVDREERPDIDAIYMAAVHAMRGSGGWPMTVWLTPDKKPYFGGTYFPPRDGDRGSRYGFLTLLKRMHGAFKEDPEGVAKAGARLQALVERSLNPTPDLTLPDAQVIRNAVQYYMTAFDPVHGGLRRAPKFPSSFPVRLLFRFSRRSGDGEPQRRALYTLEKMARGGMYDHVDGGFHRYSTDARWLVPHFEKMLYDNALLVVAYLEAWQVSGSEEMKRVAREILRYVEREMTAPSGGFYSATDADSLTRSGHREEGYFFTWRPEEIDSLLPSREAELVKRHFGVTPRGNFEGRNILHVATPLADVAKQLHLSEQDARQLLESARAKLYEARSKRPSPLRDEKILTAWNGLMISAFAQAGLLLDEPRYVEAAARAATFVLEELRQGGRLLRSYKDGKAYGDAFLDDYAFFIAALLDLYESSREPRWLGLAIDLEESLRRDYEDDQNGGFYMTSDRHEQLLAREKPTRDGAIPSGNAVALMNLLRLHEFTTKVEYHTRAMKALRAMSGSVRKQPVAHAESLLALDYHLDDVKEIVIVAPREDSLGLSTLMSVFRRTYLPNKILSVVPAREQLPSHAALVPLVAEKRPLKDRATAYVCTRRVCKLPTSDPEVFRQQIVQAKDYESAR